MGTEVVINKGTGKTRNSNCECELVVRIREKPRREKEEETFFFLLSFLLGGDLISTGKTFEFENVRLCENLT